ncbi:phosphohydrolase [Clostridium sp. LP20]|uniref:phosphohydrolase n=1 Tax=Clostridium sp. LP20 TaxID=3418665 RepID=UPI003EE47CC3
MRLGDYILTATGIEFWPLDPRVKEISIRDIGHALSLTCRANGHYKNFYSVGQHSIYCAQEAKLRGYSKRVQLACLLHDGSEAYISDITRPVKKQLDSYIKIEEKLQKAVYEAFRLSDLTDEELELVKIIDDAMLKYEMENLLNYSGIEAEDIKGEYNLGLLMMNEVEEEFIELAEELQL